MLVLALETILQRELRVQRALSENKNLWNQRQLQYEMSRENIAMITRKCHDMKHQIEALIQTESHSERRKSFIESVQDMIEVYDNDVHTGNEGPSHRLDMCGRRKTAGIYGCGRPFYHYGKCFG